MKHLWAVVLLSILCIGCAQTDALVSTDSDPYTALNQRAEDEDAIITLASGEQHLTDSVRVSADSAVWRDPETGEITRVSAVDIDRIVVINHGQGALLGAPMGAAIGAGIGFMLGSSDDCATSTSMCWDFSGPFALIGGGVGALVGVLVGGNIGARHTYEFENGKIEQARN